MAWLQVTFATDRTRVPLIETALSVADALAVTLTDAGDDAQLEPPPGATPFWSELLVTGLFPGDPHTHALAERLADSLTGQFEGRPRIELAPRFAALLRPEGDLVLSGILEEQVDAVAAAYAPAFHLETPCTEDGWVVIPARRKPSCP
jgi:hypothetical protein